jgi:hypothetical protein
VGGQLLARIAAIRELLDRGYGRPRQAVEVSAPAGDPLQELFEDQRATARSAVEPRRRGGTQRSSVGNPN